MQVNISELVDVDAQLVMTGRGCIIGQSGSGKSYLVGVIAEELCRLGMPFCIVDTEGEYSSLRNMFKVITVGGDKPDLPVDVDYKKLFYESITNNVPVVLDVSDEIDKTAPVYKALETVYKMESELHKPYLIIIEEGDKFAPQVTHQKINIIEEISVRGRKKGIGLLVATQRPSSISKNVLSQCSYGFIGKLAIENDLDAISILFSDRKILNEIVNLKSGEFVPFGVGISTRFTSKARVAVHTGATPMISESKTGNVQLGKIINNLKGTKKAIKGFHKETEEKNTEIESMPLNIDEELIEEYASKIAKKQFGIFGKTVEKIDSVELKYMGMGLCRIRVPTGKRNEFSELFALVDDKCNFITLGKEIEPRKIKNGKEIRFSETDSKVLSAIRSRGRLDLDGIERFSGVDYDKAMRSAERLVDADIIVQNKDKFEVIDKKKYLLKAEPPTEEKKTDVRMLIETKVDQKLAKKCIESVFPNSSFDDFRIVHLPVYDIKLRSNSTVRVFRVDGMYGKEILTN